MLGASLLLFGASAISAGNLLLSRTLARRTEFATRLALGARPAQILFQLWAEGAVVAVAAMTAGLALAQVAIRVLVAAAPNDIPRLSEAGLDFRSFCFAAAAALIAAVGCTVIPGWSATKGEPGAGAERRRRQILIVSPGHCHQKRIRPDAGGDNRHSALHGCLTGVELSLP